MNGVQFEPVSRHPIISPGFRLNNKILFAGFPGVIYDGVGVKANTFYGYFSGADDTENIYFTVQKPNSYKVAKTKNEIANQIGNEIYSPEGSIGIGGVQLFDNTYVVFGYAINNNNSITYVLENNIWAKVNMKTPYRFSAILSYQGQIIASSGDGALLVLVKK